MIEDRGSGNEILVSPETRQRLEGTIEVNGSRNRIVIEDGCSSSGRFRAVVGHDCSLTVGERCRLSHNFVFLLAAAHVAIGAGTTFNGACWIQLHEASTVSIGRDCLFGGDTNITTSDMHSIIDVESGARVNPAASVTLGDHVWVGARAFILKGSRVGEGAVVGLGAIVTADIPAFSVAAGNPARVVRTGVTWRRELLPMAPVRS